MTEVTRILSQIEDGDPSAAEELLPLVYNELRKVAVAKLANEKPGQTIQATALVHDAFIRLVDQEYQQEWDNSRHFFAAAAKAMGRILIECARQKATQKRGGKYQRITLSDLDVALPMACNDILGLEEALQQLGENHPRKAELVRLRFFAGLTVAQAARVLEVSVSTAENDWTYARAWLRIEITRD